MDHFHRPPGWKGSPMRSSISVPTTLSLRDLDDHSIQPRLLLLLTLDGREFSALLISLSRCFSFGRTGSPPKCIGSDGRRSGNMCRESRSSPRTAGGLGGAHSDLSNVRENRLSIDFCAAASLESGSEVAWAAWAAWLAEVSSLESESLSPRSAIYFDMRRGCRQRDEALTDFRSASTPSLTR